MRKYTDKDAKDVIWDTLEDSMELNEETKREIAEARAEIKAGKFHTHAAVKRELGL